MKSKPVIFRTAFLYLGAVIGAGFASGRENWQYFGIFGEDAYKGILLATGLFVFMGTATTLVEFHSNIILIMRISAIMPIKLHNERCPGKNTRMLGNKPLLQHELDNLKATGLCDKICVFCSDESVTQYLPQGVDFIKRSLELDLPTSNFTQIFAAFMEVEKADI